MYKVKKVKPEKMSKELYKKCVSLCYRKNGLMSLYLSNAKFKKTNENSDCYVIQNENKLLAWAIVYRNEVHYYTRKTHRRKGLAKKLADQIHKDYSEKELISGIYDKKSEKFYANFKYKRINFEDE